MGKYELIPEQLLYEGTIKPPDLHSPEAVSEENILLTHKKEYWERMRDLMLMPAEVRRIGFPLSSQLIDRERRIAQGTIDGSLYALTHGVAFNIAGGTHHAGSYWGEGFCLLNDQAIAANYLLKKALCQRILIVDLDVHQGNGTAEIFNKEERVFTFSMHGQTNFPFRKEISDLDIGLPDGTADQEYLKELITRLPPILEAFKPDFVFYLSGVDVLATDKLGKLNLSVQACKDRDEIVLRLCQQHKVPMQISMGGGYSPRISHIVDAHCNTFRLAVNIFG